MSTQKENINEAFGRILHMKFKDKKKKNTRTGGKPFP